MGCATVKSVQRYLPFSQWRNRASAGRDPFVAQTSLLCGMAASSHMRKTVSCREEWRALMPFLWQHTRWSPQMSMHDSPQAGQSAPAYVSGRRGTPSHHRSRHLASMGRSKVRSARCGLTEHHPAPSPVQVLVSRHWSRRKRGGGRYEAFLVDFR